MKRTYLSAVIALLLGVQITFAQNVKHPDTFDAYEQRAQFDYVVKLEPEYFSGYSFRAESYFGLKKWDEAIDDVIRSLSIDGNDKAFYLMQELADSSRTSLVAKLRLNR